MTDYQLSERIVVSKHILHGKPRIVGTRILVSQVLDLLGAGKSIEEITGEDYFPDITASEVMACIRYASELVKTETIIPIS